MRTDLALGVPAAALIFVCSAFHAHSASLEMPAKVSFLDVPPNSIEGRFVLQAGKVYLNGAGGKMVEAKLPVITAESLASYQGEGVYILGAPAVVAGTRTIEVPELLAGKGATVRGSITDDGILFVNEKRAPDPSDLGRVVTSFSVYRAKGTDMQTLGTFSFADNVYNQYLEEIWPIDGRTLAIVSHSSRHRAIRTLFLFDLKQKRVVGMREFSKFQYLPHRESFWMMQSIANCENMSEMLEAAKKDAVVLPIYAKGVISDAFKNLEGIMQGASLR
jgi:hypothetical protein